MKCLVNLCLVVVIAASVALAQTRKTPPTSATKTAVENRSSKTDELREHQLRVFRDHVLSRALDNIKKMDEAGLRVSARNQILTCLASEKNLSDEKETLITQIARDSLTDLRDHNEEMTPFMLSYLSNDLASWVKKHRPNLLEEVEKTINANVKVDASQRIRALFNLEGGDALAVKSIRQELEAGGALNGLNFWLDELMKRNSKEFEP